MLARRRSPSTCSPLTVRNQPSQLLAPRLTGPACVADYVEQFGFKAESPPELGCYIHGLYIEGCTWDADNNTLTESEPKTLFVQMPTIHIVVAQSAEMG